MILEILFLIAIRWLQTQLGTTLKNRTTNFYAHKTISLVIFGLNCFVIFSLKRFYSAGSERFKTSNPQEELQSLAEFKTSIVNCLKELIARMKQYVGWNDQDQYCGRVGLFTTSFGALTVIITSKPSKVLSMKF